MKFTVSDATHAAQHNEIDRLERLVEKHVAHVSSLEQRHVVNMMGCEVMSVVLANMSDKVSHISTFLFPLFSSQPTVITSPHKDSEVRP